MKAKDYIALIKKAKTTSKADKLLKEAINDDDVRVDDILHINKEVEFRKDELAWEKV